MLIGKLGSHSAMAFIVLINAKITTRLTTRKDEYFINFKYIFMGDFADDLMMRGLDEELKWEYHDTHYNDIHYKSLLKEYLKGKLLWGRKDQKHILIQDMADDHLINSIHWIERNHLDRTCMVELKDILLIEKYNRKL